MRRCRESCCARILSPEVGRAGSAEGEEDDGSDRNSGAKNDDSSRGGGNGVARVWGGAERGRRGAGVFYYARRSRTAEFSSIVRVAGGRIYLRYCERSEGDDVGRIKWCQSWDPEQVETLELSQGQGS